MTSAEQLLANLRAAGAEGLELQDLEAILDRVAATPKSILRQGWVKLIAESADKVLADALDNAVPKLASYSANGTKGRLSALRGQMEKQALDGFVIPKADPHQGEYIAASAERLAWLTGFTGSAGLAFVTGSEAWLFVDGRYTLQADQQIDTDHVQSRHFRQPAFSEFAGQSMEEGQDLGYDPNLHSVLEIEGWAKNLQEKGIALVAVDRNPLDVIWSTRPLEPFAPIVAHDIQFSGKSTDDKLDELFKVLTQAGADGYALNQLDSLAWAFNLRGGDTPNTPLAQGFAFLDAENGTADLFVDEKKVTDDLRRVLSNRVTLKPIGSFESSISNVAMEGRAIAIDPRSTTMAIKEMLEEAGANIVRSTDPTAVARACKNAVEVEGARNAHIRDGAALCEFLAWLDKTVDARDVTELEAVEALEGFRAKRSRHRGASFDTIAGSGPNGAIVHYRVSPESNRVLDKGSCFLLDSGGQYYDGTTDVTRTIAIGNPKDAIRRHFTLVLGGHIALAMAHFPKGTTGAQLDILARQPLWSQGLNFDHGTGHGVGSYLGVHEGPQNISSASQVPLQPGMILSNEPGFYETGSHGIRIENLVVVTPVNEGGEFLCFETITLAPIDKRMIDRDLLNPTEVDWLNAYHARVHETLIDLVDEDTKGWLIAATEPL